MGWIKDKMNEEKVEGIFMDFIQKLCRKLFYLVVMFVNQDFFSFIQQICYQEIKIICYS